MRQSLIFGQGIGRRRGLRFLAPASTTLHVADEPARLALVNPAVGLEVIQGDTGQRWQFNGPSNGVAGYFVAGGSLDGGIQTVRGESGGRPSCNLLGAPDDPLTSGLFWVPNLDQYVAVYESISSVSGYVITDAEGNGVYFAQSDVSSPDLVTTVGDELWRDGTTGINASLTVTPVTQGELDAAVRVQSDPGDFGYIADKYLRDAAQEGRPTYVGPALGIPLSFGDGHWTLANELFAGPVPVAPSPWSADWSDAFANYGIVVIRDDNVAENWSLVA